MTSSSERGAMLGRIAAVRYFPLLPPPRPLRKLRHRLRRVEKTAPVGRIISDRDYREWLRARRRSRGDQQSYVPGGAPPLAEQGLQHPSPPAPAPPWQPPDVAPLVFEDLQALERAVYGEVGDD